MRHKCPNNIVLNLNRLPGESDEEHIERIYKLFLPQLTKMCASLFRGKPIRIPDYGEPDFYKAFFYHLISYNIATKHFSYQRLITCCYLPMILNSDCVESCALVSDKKSSKKKKRKTLFCQVHNFVIVYEDRKSSFYVCTAYHVSKKHASKFI